MSVAIIKLMLPVGYDGTDIVANVTFLKFSAQSLDSLFIVNWSFLIQIDPAWEQIIPPGLRDFFNDSI